MPQDKPEGYHNVQPYLVVPGAAGFIQFLKQVLDAEETFRLPSPSGENLLHAEMRVGDSIIMLADPGPGEAPFPARLLVYVADPDETYRRAMAAGATSIAEPADMFFGERAASVLDPYGNHWNFHARGEPVPPDEFQKRVEELYG
jgi:PhnB protein